MWWSINIITLLLIHKITVHCVFFIQITGKVPITCVIVYYAVLHVTEIKQECETKVPLFYEDYCYCKNTVLLQLISYTQLKFSEVSGTHYFLTLKYDFVENVQI